MDVTVGRYASILCLWPSGSSRGRVEVPDSNDQGFLESTSVFLDAFLRRWTIYSAW